MTHFFVWHRQVDQEEFEDTEGVIRIHKSKDRQHNDKKKGTEGQTMINKALHIKLKIQQGITHKTKDQVTQTH